MSDLHEFDDFEVSDKEYENAMGGGLTPLDSAKVSGATARWPEQVALRSWSLEEWDGGNNAEAGDRTLMLQLRFQVCETSPDGFGGVSPNAGESIFQRWYMNLTAYKERMGSGHQKMTRGNIGKAAALAEALGIENDFGGTPMGLLRDHADEVVGSPVIGTLKQQKKDDGRIDVEITNFLPLVDDEG